MILETLRTPEMLREASLGLFGLVFVGKPNSDESGQVSPNSENSDQMLAELVKHGLELDDVGRVWQARV